MKKLILAVVFAASVAVSPVALAKCGTGGGHGQSSGHTSTAGQTSSPAAASNSGHGGCGQNWYHSQFNPCRPF